MSNTRIEQLLEGREHPVILLEGTRRLDPAQHDLLARLAHWLCARFPHASFRSGNADGTDTVFAQAVAEHHPSRLELVLPHPGMGRARRPPGVRCLSFDALPQQELERLVALAGAGEQSTGRLVNFYLTQPPPRKSGAASKATYLLRDALKVVGSPALGLAPASFGIFFVDAAKPEGGGTGHTIRICRAQSVPVAIQSEWAQWLPPAAV